MIVFSRLVSSGIDAVFHSVSCCLLPVAQLEFGKDVFHVYFGRIFSNVEPVCDLCILEPLGHQA